MGLNPALVATADAASEAVRNERLFWAGLVLVGVLLAGAAVLAWLERWRKRMMSDAATGADSLAAFRLSYERGELSEDEYRRIRARLGAGRPAAGPATRAASAERPPAAGETPAAPAAD
jgi:hypothetical protein